MEIMLFDGSMEELIMAVYHVYIDKKEPILYRWEDHVPNLLDTPVDLQFNEDAFLRVRAAMRKKFDRETLTIISHALCHADKNAPLLLLRYIMRCFEDPRCVHDYQNELVMKITKLSRQVSLEAHRFKGFVRFSLAGDLYFAKILPDHDILAFIAPHFTRRYQEMNFVIYDEKRKQAVVSQKGQWHLEKDLVLKEGLFKDDVETARWKAYFDHISIDHRKNSKAQKRSMPRRYWGNLPEISDENK